MSIGGKAKSIAINAKEFVGEKTGDVINSRKTTLSFAVGNFASSAACAVVAAEIDSKPMPNDKITALALGASAIAGIASGVHWQSYHQEREQRPTPE